MTFSKEQNDIFEYAEKGPFNMVVQAVAGAGKTTTLVECVNHIPANKRILILAHNRSTRDTLKERIAATENINIFTLHGLGWRMFCEHFGTSPDIDDEKYKKYVYKNLDEIAGEEYLSLSKGNKLVYRSNIFDIIDKARQNLKQSGKEIKKLAVKKYGIPVVANECETAATILKWGLENTDTVDYQDLLWFPSQYGYYTKKYVADIIMLDEAQDASIAQQDIIKRCFKRETRMFSFGDKDQTINSWCGSDAESFEHLKDADEFRRPAVEFPLTTNYRCGKKIIEYAKAYTDNDIKPREDAGDGVVRINASISEAVNGDMILCRNIAPLMEVYRRGVTNGQKMYFRGESLGENLILAAESTGGNTINEIVFELKQKLIALWEAITNDTGADEKETMLDPRITSLMDTIRTMDNLPKTVETRRDLDKFSKDVFSDEGKDGIQLSTIHRAKGLEAENVFIICPSLCPSSSARLGWQIEEERHLLYVMCTRARESLNFVSENEVRPYGIFLDSNSLYSELTDIRNEVKNGIN